jgi:ATP-dependent exoDNAse (exonuclease V) beta subunit
VSTGPHDGGSGEDRPRLCQRAAELVADLRARAPGRSIGVLTRKNRTVARLMLELRDLGIRASEEGGNPLTDSAAVVAVVSLLRLADHPGDRVARYHVARTPLGEVVGLRDHQDGAGARRVAHRLRRQLLENGYGRTLDELAAKLEDACDARDRRRLAQLAEMGFRYDARATLRTTDFVRLVEAEKVEDPTAADVRVMTVHQSKGLEFDVVVLPELDLSLAGGGRPKPLTYRPDPAGGVTRVFPYVNEATRALFPDVPELEGAAEQAAAARWRDALSGLYVAQTRATQAQYVVVKPDLNGKGELKESTARTSARLVRCALGLKEPTGEDRVIFESGDPQWFASADGIEPGTAPDSGDAAGGKLRVQIRPASGTRRTLAQVSPSSLAGGEKVDLRGFLQLDRRAAEQGTLAHAWFEQIAWVEDGVPSDEELRAIALQVTPTLPADAVESLRVRFRSWLAVPEIRFLLNRNGYAPGATVERELPFFHRADGRLVEGIIDRLVVLRDAGRVVGAEILDYKTDALKQGDPTWLADKASHYTPQLDAYRAAVAHGFGIEPSRIAARLIFLEAAAVVEV